MPKAIICLGSKRPEAEKGLHIQNVKMASLRPKFISSFLCRNLKAAECLFHQASSSSFIRECLPPAVGIAPQLHFHRQPKLARIRCSSSPSHFTDKTLISIKVNTSLSPCPSFLFTFSITCFFHLLLCTQVECLLAATAQRVW